jgi:hypothetical protein
VNSIRRTSAELERVSALLSLVLLRKQMHALTRSINWDRRLDPEMEQVRTQAGLDIEKFHQVLDLAMLPYFTDPVSRRTFMENRGLSKSATRKPAPPPDEPESPVEDGFAMSDDDDDSVQASSHGSRPDGKPNRVQLLENLRNGLVDVENKMADMDDDEFSAAMAKLQGLLDAVDESMEGPATKACFAHMMGQKQEQIVKLAQMRKRFVLQ